MKRFTVYILSLGIFLQSVQWHAEEVRELQLFFQDAAEHLIAGDSFISFLQKHYGDHKIVSKHLQEKHPDRQKKEKHKHTHHLEPVYAWQLHVPVIEISLPDIPDEKPGFRLLPFRSLAGPEPPDLPPETV